MAVIADFVKIPKKDTCKHLSSGMCYASFIQWCGFVIPEILPDSSRMAGSDADLEFRKEITYYTQTRIGNSRDFFLLLCNSISESVSENVTLLDGTVNVDLLSKCNNATEFLEIVKESCAKFANKVIVRPILGINSENENNLPLANILLESGAFGGIELYGRAFVENPEKFLSIFNTARRLNIDSRICCLGFRDFADRETIVEIIQNLKPTVILNPNIAICDASLAIFKNGKILPEVYSFLRDNNIRAEFSPAPLLSGRCADEKTHAIREFAEKGLPFSLCTEDMLFLNKSLSEFAADLCNAGVFSQEELVSLIQN